MWGRCGWRATWAIYRGLELGVQILGQRLALGLEPLDLVGDVDRRIVLDEAGWVDLLLEFGDRRFEIKKVVFIPGCPSQNVRHCNASRPPAYGVRAAPQKPAFRAKNGAAPRGHRPFRKPPAAANVRSVVVGETQQVRQAGEEG